VSSPPPETLKAPLRDAPATAAVHRHSPHLLPHFLDALRSTLLVIIAALFVLTFLVQPFRIPSESMERTLLVGDFLLVDRAALAPAGSWGWLLPYRHVTRGDIVVFHFPVDPEDHVVKRVIGVPGDSVALDRGLARVNGSPLPQPYAVFEPAEADEYRDQFPHYTTSDPAVEPGWQQDLRSLVHQGRLTVTPGNYFVLGDNRNHSRDSRYWGFVPQQNIVGTPLLVYFSLREPSATDETPPPDGRLGNSARSWLADVARWDRTLHVIR
jgi:signal peptidase I